MTTDSTRRSTPQLFSEVLAQVTALMRAELRLVRAEIGEKLSQMATGAALIGVAAVVMIAALVLLLHGLAAWLVAAGWQAHWAALLVGGVAAAIAVVLLMKAMSDLKASNLKPDRTLHQLNKDLNVAKEQVQ
jgi:hypothetical protein